MMKTRKLIAVILILVMTLTMTQMTAFAGSGEKDITTMASCDIAALGDGEEGGDTEGGAATDATGATDESQPGSTDPTQTSSDDPTEPSATDPTQPSSTEPTQPSSTDPTKTTQPTTKPKPAVPKVTVKKSGPALLVSWTAFTGANYYEVYRSYKKGSRGTLIKKVTTLSKRYYKDKAVKSGKRAYYTVRAHKKAGGYSGYSVAVSNIIYRVYIETGHGIDARGRWDPGCTWSKYQEAKLMIPICKSMTKYLRAKGVYVYTDAFNGNKTNLKWMLKHLKGYNVSVLVNVHCDYKKAPRGTLPLYRYSDQKKLAKCLNTGVHKTVKIRNRGLKYRKNLACLNQTHSYCTSCLFETGNIKKDNKILRTKYDAYGKGLAMGVCSYLGVKW